MNIKIEQTLHGYETGHQLLMSSTLLSNDAKQILLVQSDLSGSNIDDKFKSYLTGYPLASYYAFSRTWYADEMRRPGCVWTQTFLIAFADLGKIADLQQLTKLFIRPFKDYYEQYANPIFLERKDLENSTLNIDYSPELSNILSAVYDNSEKTILIPSNSSSEYENYVLQIWSNQWPRLRRNFSFCTGALSLKYLEGREFDLQVIPHRNLLSIEKQTTKGFSVNTNISGTGNANWTEILFRAPKNSLRRFLWLYGSDVAGIRKNYRPLISLYDQSTRAKSDFSYVNEIIKKSFESPSDGLKIKNELFGDDHIFHFDNKEVLSYLLKADQGDLINLDQINLTQRLLKAYNNQVISFSELVEFYLNAAPNRLSEQLWNEIIINDTQLLSVITKDERLIKHFAPRITDLALLQDTWKQPYSFQLNIVAVLDSIQLVNWKSVIFSILDARSDIISEVLKRSNRRILIALLWMDANNYAVSKNLNDRIFGEFRHFFIEFIKENVGLISPETCNKLFQNLNVSEIQNLGFNASNWLKIYHQISDDNTKLFASCVLLSLGFNHKVSNAAALVVGCFSDVYYFAKAAKVTPHEWGILPVDMSEEDDEERDAFTIILNFVNLFSPKKHDVPSWDYCELLIRTLVNKFIKYKWPNQAFLECLPNEHLTLQAIRYALSFKKGAKFIGNILWDIRNGKIHVGKHQLTLINQIGEKFK